MKAFSRRTRVNEQIQRELAELLRGGVKDPRIGMVTITGVTVTPDYAHAKVFYTVLGDEQQKTTTLAGLKQAAGFLRNELFHRIKLHTIPQLHFEYDESLERGLHLSQLIAQANPTPDMDE